jgi:hypothetical protein
MVEKDGQIAELKEQIEMMQNSINRASAIMVQKDERITDLKIENVNLQEQLKDRSRDDDDGGHDPTYG